MKHVPEFVSMQAPVGDADRISNVGPPAAEHEGDESPATAILAGIGHDELSLINLSAGQTAVPVPVPHAGGSRSLSQT